MTEQATTPQTEKRFETLSAECRQAQELYIAGINKFEDDKGGKRIQNMDAKCTNKPKGR